MGRDRSTTDAAFGFQVWGPLKGAHWYAVATNPTVGMYIGHSVEDAGTTYATKKRGNLQGVVHEETGAAGTMVGAVIAIEDYLGQPAQCIAATTTGDGVISGYVLVADHPDQEFVVAEDGVTSSIVAANVGLNVDGVGTGNNSNTYISTMEIDSDTINVTATLGWKVLGVHPDDSLSAAGAAGNHCRFIVKCNSHWRGHNVASV